MVSRRTVLRSGVGVAALFVAACNTDNPSSDPDNGNAESAGAGNVSEQSMADFYEGELIHVIVPAAPGGGTDASARAISEFMKKHIPGNPKFVIENLAGGAGFQGMNEYWHNRAPDGYELLQSSSARCLGWVLESADVEYDYAKLHPLWGSPSVGIVYVHADGPVKQVSDLGKLSEPLYYAGGDPTAGDLSILLGLHMLEVNVEATLGYDGRGPSRIAFEQGEADINYDAAISYRKDVEPLVEAGKVRPIFTLGYPNAQGAIDRDPNYPELPHIGEVYEELKGEPPSGEAWESYQAIFPARVALNDSMWIHDSAPDVAIAALELGLERMVADPEFDKARQELMGDYPVRIGKELDASVQTLLQSRGNPALKYLKDFLANEYGAKF